MKNALHTTAPANQNSDTVRILLWGMNKAIQERDPHRLEECKGMFLAYLMDVEHSPPEIAAMVVREAENRLCEKHVAGV